MQYSSVVCRLPPASSKATIQRAAEECPSTHLHAGKLLTGPLQSPRCLLPGICHPLLSCPLSLSKLLLLQLLRRRSSLLLRPLCRL
jgi:hypothetical protein